MNKKQKSLTNKGFSLVELIIVIAIMAVLVGVLAPQFIKYVEQSRKSTDIQNAENIKTAVLADIADGKITGTNTNAGGDKFTNTMTTSIKTAPTPAGSYKNNKVDGFYVTYNATYGTCSVSVKDSATGSTKAYTLTDPEDAADYKEEK